MSHRFVKFSLPLIVFTIVFIYISSTEAILYLNARLIKIGWWNIRNNLSNKGNDWCKLTCKTELATLDHIEVLAIKISNYQHLKLRPVNCDCKNGKMLYFYPSVYNLYVFQYMEREKELKYKGFLNCESLGLHINYFQWEMRDKLRFFGDNVNNVINYMEWNPFVDD